MTKEDPIISVFVLCGHFETVYSKEFIWAKSVLNVMNSTNSFCHIRATRTQQYRRFNNGGSSAGQWRAFRNGFLSSEVETTVAQTAIAERRIFSSSQSEIGNSYLIIVRTASCTRHTDMSRRAVIVQDVARKDIVMDDNACIHDSRQQILYIKLNNQTYCSSGNGVHDLGSWDKWWLFNKEASLSITSFVTKVVGNGSEDKSYFETNLREDVDK